MATEHYHHYEHHQTVAERPVARQAIKLATAGTVGLTCLALSGLTMTGTVLAVVVLTPLLVLFSPVLVPAAAAVVLAGIGLLLSGGCGVAAAGMVSWVYSYVKGRHPVGADSLDHVRQVVEDAASDLKEKVLEVKDRVAEDVAEAGDRAVEVKEKTRDKGRKGQHKAQQDS